MKISFWLLLLFFTLGNSNDVPQYHCFKPEEDNKINMNKRWNYDEKGQDNYCYDNDGVAYEYYSEISSCCGCLRYECSIGCYGAQNPEKKILQWTLSNVSNSCCQDCQGRIFPPDEVVSIRHLEDVCQTVQTDTCKYSEAINEDSGVIIQTYKSYNCCLDNSGLSQVNVTKFDLPNCGEKTCTQGRPSYWLSEIKFAGSCGCCEFNNTLVPDKWEQEVEDGRMIAVCCDGNILYKDSVQSSSTSKPTNTTFSPPSCSWTGWINRDHPSGSGDYEKHDGTCTLSKYEVTLVSGGPVYDNVSLVPNNQLWIQPHYPTIECINRIQVNCSSNPCCLDYKARFCCLPYASCDDWVGASDKNIYTMATTGIEDTSTKKACHIYQNGGGNIVRYTKNGGAPWLCIDSNGNNGDEYCAGGMNYNTALGWLKKLISEGKCGCITPNTDIPSTRRPTNITNF